MDRWGRWRPVSELVPFVQEAFVQKSSVPFVPFVQLPFVQTSGVRVLVQPAVEPKTSPEEVIAMAASLSVCEPALRFRV